MITCVSLQNKPTHSEAKDQLTRNMGAWCGLGRSAEMVVSNNVAAPETIAGILRVDGDIHIALRQPGRNPPIRVMQVVGDLPEYTVVDGRLVPSR